VSVPSQPAGPRGLLVVIALLAMLGPFTIDTYLPSFPAIEAELGVGPAAMAQTLSLYLLAFAGMTLLWGPLSDAFGRRRVITASLLLYVATAVGCALTTDFSTLLFLRVVQGLAASGGMTVGRAVIRDVYAGPGAQRAMSTVMVVFALAPALAPILGGFLHDWWGWRSVFVFLALYGVAGLGLVRFALPETLQRDARQSIHPVRVLHGYGRSLTQPRFVALVLAIGAAFGGVFLYVSGSPAIVFEHLSYGADDFGILFVPRVVGLVLGSLISGRLAHRLPQHATVDVAFAVMAVGVLINLLQAHWLAPGPWTVIGPLVLYAFGAALAMPGVTVMALDCFPSRRGMASAMQGFVQMVVMAIVSGVLMPLAVVSIPRLVLGQLALFAVALLFWATVRVLHRLGRTGCVE